MNEIRENCEKSMTIELRILKQKCHFGMMYFISFYILTCSMMTRRKKMGHYQSDPNSQEEYRKKIDLN